MTKLKAPVGQGALVASTALQEPNAPTGLFTFITGNTNDH